MMRKAVAKLILNFRDEALTNTLNKVISGFLPHENFESKKFSMFYSRFQKILSKEDSRGVYYIFQTILEKYNTLSVIDDYTVEITEKKFSDSLENNIFDYIKDPASNIKEIMAEEGQSADITNPLEQQKIANIFYSKCMALYQACFEMKVSTDDAISALLELDDVIQKNIIETCTNLQRTIINTGITLKGRNYIGIEGWTEITGQTIREITNIRNRKDTAVVCDDYSKLKEVEQEATQAFEPLCNYGLPTLDDYTPMLKHRLAVIVGRENVGKTKVMTDLIVKVILEGKKPYVAIGETSRSNFISQVISTYIFKKYELNIEPTMLYGENLKAFEKEEQQIIETAKAEVMTSGMVVDEGLTYDTVFSTFVQRFKEGCEAFFIDHTQSLNGRNNRPMLDLVTNLALDCREFKNMFPAFICILSHPSSDVKDILQTDPEKIKNLQLSPTARSATLSQEADEIFIIYSTEALSKQGLLGWITYKRRGPQIPTIYIRKHFHVSAFSYDEQDQAGSNDVEEEEFESLLSAYSSDDSDGLDVEI